MSEEIASTIDHTFETAPVEHVPQVVEVNDPPPPDLAEEVRHYYALLQIEYTRRVSEIEKFLGFAAASDGLGTRLAKVEAFLGIKS